MALKTNLTTTLLAGALAAWLGGAGYAQTPQPAEPSTVAPAASGPSDTTREERRAARKAERREARKEARKEARREARKEARLASRGAPGPLAGVGLPALALAGGAYWLVRRRRNRVNGA
jgi:hypothetical protein